MIEKYLLNDDYTRALYFAENLVKNDPNNQKNYWCLGLVYLLMGEESEAENIWMSVIFDCLEKILPKLPRI
jgi:Tfp pilus assembly protein PilF